MTVCIGLISKNKILAIADKKFTNNNGAMTSGYQISDNKKIVELSRCSIAMFAGHIVNANEVLSMAMSNIGQADDVLVVADKVKNAYIERFKRAINEEILSKMNLDLDMFNAQQRSLDETYVNNTIQVINNPATNLGIEIVVAGMVNGKPKLLKILHPGTIVDETPIGYSSIGSGSNHANISMIESEYHQGTEEPIALYALIKAKRKAEYDPNVGEMSTIYIIGSKVESLEIAKVEELMGQYDQSLNEIKTISNRYSKKIEDILK